MKASLHNFMAGLIDYAGFYPPAGLDIETTVGNYAGYLSGADGWMLGRCIIPATMLHRVVHHPGLRCLAIVSPAISREEVDQLVTSPGRVEVVETRLPENADTPGRCSDHLVQLTSRLKQAGLRDMQLFVEAGSFASAGALASALATFNNCRHGGEIVDNAGYKLRCGGLEKQDFPTPGQVAEVIALCREYDIPIKFTAGMHHPLRKHSPELAVMQHGFINIFAAALLCWAASLSTEQIAECLRDESASHFHFTKDCFSWKDQTISADEIKRLRRIKVISFGSCSFTEPIEGLRSLGFLDNTGV